MCCRCNVAQHVQSLIFNFIKFECYKLLPLLRLATDVVQANRWIPFQLEMTDMCATSQSNWKSKSKKNCPITFLSAGSSCHPFHPLQRFSLFPFSSTGNSIFTVIAKHIYSYTFTNWFRHHMHSCSCRDRIGSTSKSNSAQTDNSITSTRSGYIVRRIERLWK